MKLSIITRTGNRLQFLERALQSVVSAAPSECEWIVCDDAVGGTPEIRSFIKQAQITTNIPIHLVESHTGNRARAANAGLQIAKGEFIHIHDDDDTVNKDFYLQVMKFLEEKTEYGGVATFCNRIDEKIVDDKIVTLSERPHYHEIHSLTLLSMATTQTVPPIAFVARKSKMDKVGEFNASLDVCEDHEYFLRFLLETDIGLIPNALAAFHQRPSNTLGSFSNSAASTNHTIVDAQFRNRMLREDITSNKIGLGWLLAVGDLNRSNLRVNMFVYHLRRNRLFSAALSYLRR